MVSKLRTFVCGDALPGMGIFEFYGHADGKHCRGKVGTMRRMWSITRVMGAVERRCTRFTQYLWLMLPGFELFYLSRRLHLNTHAIDLGHPDEPYTFRNSFIRFYIEIVLFYRLFLKQTSFFFPFQQIIRFTAKKWIVISKRNPAETTVSRNQFFCINFFWIFIFPLKDDCDGCTLNFVCL